MVNFHKTAGVAQGEGTRYIGEYPAFRAKELRARLIMEEAMEFVEACGVDPIHLAHDLGRRRMVPKADFIEAIDALADLNYVTAGAYVAFGVDDDPVFDEVHRSNMEKFVDGRPLINEWGKIVKPPGWKAPDIVGELKKQGWSG